MSDLLPAHLAAARLAALDLAREAVLVFGDDGRILDWSASAEQLYGWTREEAVGRSASALFGSAVAAVDDIAPDDAGNGRDERQARDGRRLAIAWRRRPVPGEPGLVAEVSAPAQSGFGLGDELARYRTLYRGAGTAIWEHDWSGVWQGVEELRGEGVSDFRRFFNANPEVLERLSSRVRILDANDEAVRLFEADDRDHLVNGPLPRIFTDDTRASFTRSLSSLIERRPRIESECGFRTLRGNPLRIMLRVTPIDEQRWSRVVVTMIDVTERTRAQQALSQALDDLAHISRVITLGELTASIAHELNQPLVAIITEGQGALRWLRRATPNLEEAQEGIARAVDAAVRAGQVMERLRAMARRGERQISRLSLAEMIEEAAQLVQRELQRRQVTFRIDKAPDVPDVAGDRIQLQQVAINLLINAAQAMEAVEDRPRLLVVSIVAQGPDRAGFEIVDTGPGIAHEARDGLFRPFFTTKPNGLGLGLSICRSIVESHNGRIWLENRPEGGAVAGVALPTADSVDLDAGQTPAKY